MAGVLFIANPVTGKRRQTVIDANPGLGEAVVSGATNPDHFVVKTATGEIVERRPGEKRVVVRGTAGGGTQRSEVSDGSNEACLSDEQVRVLSAYPNNPQRNKRTRHVKTVISFLRPPADVPRHVE